MGGVRIEGKNWCIKYDREIDYELVHEICEDPHPKGCANCNYNTYHEKLEVVGEKEVK